MILAGIKLGTVLFIAVLVYTLAILVGSALVFFIKELCRNLKENRDNDRE